MRFWQSRLERKLRKREAVAMTNDEARDQIISAARFSAWYWVTQVDDSKPASERVEGAIFTFLAELDGVGSHPTCDIVVLETDEDGKTIGEQRVSTMLHEFFYKGGWDASRGPL